MRLELEDDIEYLKHCLQSNIFAYLAPTCLMLLVSWLVDWKLIGNAFHYFHYSASLELVFGVEICRP